MKPIPATVKEIMVDILNDKREQVFCSVSKFASPYGRPMEFRDEIFRLLRDMYDHYTARQQHFTSQVCYEICMRHSHGAVAKFKAQSPSWVTGHLPDTEEPVKPWAQPTGEIQTTPTTKEPIMANNAPIFETKTFIRGTDAAALSNEAIFSVITEAEARIEQLNKIEHKPKALKDEIEALNIGLQNIVTFVDGRS